MQAESQNRQTQNNNEISAVELSHATELHIKMLLWRPKQMVYAG